MIADSMARNSEFSDGFLNVDLEVYSRQPLDRLAAALEEAADLLFLGKTGSRYLAALELRAAVRKESPMRSSWGSFSI